MISKRPLILDTDIGADRSPEYFAEHLERPVLSLNDADETVFARAPYLLTWRPRPGTFDKFQALEVIFSLGAGVDGLMRTDPPQHIPIVRFVDPDMTQLMADWVCHQCLNHLRDQSQYASWQADRHWGNKQQQPMASEVRVGVMGLGELGSFAARRLAAMGFDVAGWSRSMKQLDGIKTYDQNGLDTFLGRTDMVVGLLPLTAQTQGLYDRSFFSKLNPDGALGGPIFINGGRGKSQVEADIIACLKDGTLKSVSLDVFEEEPLHENSPLWGFDHIYLTPHSSAVSRDSGLVRHLSEQLQRYESGLPLQHLVERDRGY